MVIGAVSNLFTPQRSDGDRSSRYSTAAVTSLALRVRQASDTVGKEIEDACNLLAKFIAVIAVVQCYRHARRVVGGEKGVREQSGEREVENQTY